MTTVVLNKDSLEQEIVLGADGDLQFLIDAGSNFNGSIFKIAYETDTPNDYIDIPDTSTSRAYSRIYTLKAGKIKIYIVNPSDSTSVKVDVR